MENVSTAKTKRQHIWSLITTHIGEQDKTIDLKLGRIPNPYDIISAIPGRGFGEGPSLNWLKTWGPPWKPISEISLNPTKSQDRKSNHFNLHKATRAGPGKHLAKGSLDYYINKDLEQITDGLVSIWEHLRGDSTVYQGVARAVTSSNTVEGRN